MSDASEIVSQLRSTLGKVEVALSTVSDAIVWTDERGIVQWCNSSFDRLLDCRHIDVLGAALSDLFPLEQGGQPLPQDAHPVSRMRAEQPSLAGRYGFRRSEQMLVLAIAGTRVQFGEHGAALVFTIQDITERERAEAALQTANGELQRQLNQVAWLQQIMMDRENEILKLTQEISVLRQDLQ